MYLKKTIKGYLDDLAAKKPVPGGGSAAALISAAGTALASMVANFTKGNSRYQKVQPQIKDILKNNEAIRKKLMVLIDRDALAYLKLNAVLKLPRENKKRDFLVQKYLKSAAAVPLEIGLLCEKAISLCEKISCIGNANLITDAGCAAYFLEAAFFSAELNTRINLKYSKDKKFVKSTDEKLKQAQRQIIRRKQEIIRRVKESV